MKRTDRELGLDRAITRRDFLQGMALAIAAQPPPGDYPPHRVGLRGQRPEAAALGHTVRDGKFRELPSDVIDTGERYDLVVVGAGISGLSAAYLYRDEAPGDPSILVLDNNDDFGGHARRNVMEYQGARLIAQGGTFALEEPDDSPDEAVEVFRRIGLDPDRLVSYRDPAFMDRFGLSPAVVFDSRAFPGKTLWRNQWTEIPYERFFAGAPLSEEGRRDLIELFTTKKNYLPDVDEEGLPAALFAMTWERFVRDKMGLGDDAIRFVNLYSTDLIGLGADAASALHGYGIGPGFYGMGGEGFYEKDGILRYAYEPVNRYPDGNHTIARHFLKKILPEAVTGPDTMEGVFNARVRYDVFDQPDNHARVRLSSMVIRLENRGDGVDVTYTRADGRLYRTRARHVVMSGWGSVAKHIVPELGEAQYRALDDYRYSSALYINVMLRHWRPIAEIGGFHLFWPDGYCAFMHVSDPLTVGSYRPNHHPDRPTILSLYKYLYQPGLEPAEQMRLGRYEMESKPFVDYEREIRSELAHVLGGHGFDPAEDIVGITVNRWGHGYNYFKEPGTAERLRNPPYLRGRARVGRISFAGADAGGSAWTQAAIAQAWRAVHEQLEL